MNFASRLAVAVTALLLAAAPVAAQDGAGKKRGLDNAIERANPKATDTLERNRDRKAARDAEKAEKKAAKAERGKGKGKKTKAKGQGKGKGKKGAGADEAKKAQGE